MASQPGPRLIVEHPDIFWGLIASFWIGNLMLVFLNVPLIGLWVKLLMVPYRYPVPERAVLHLHRRLRGEEHALRRRA